MTTTECNDKRVRLKTKSTNKPMESSYCRMCYDKQCKDIPSEARKANCNGSSMGCVQCDEPICAQCWPAYKHPKAAKKD